MGDIAHQLGFAEESVYGTAVTPTRFLEFTTESLELRHNIAASSGIRSGRRYGGSGRRITREDAGGAVTFEVPRSGFGVFLEYLLGGVSSVNTIGTVWTHTFTPATLLGKSLTLQKGVEKADGTVQAFTYPGTKVLAIDFSNDQDGLLMATVEFDAREEETATALASASYTTPVVFTYAEGSLEVDDAVKANVRSLGSLRIQNNFNVERFFLGSGGLKSEPINTPFDSITGRLDVEFQNLTDFYALFAADTEAKLELIYTGAVIEGAHNYQLAITVNNVRFEGETPKVTGPALVYQNIPFVGLDDPVAGAAISVVYKTTDTTP
jgi:hypothetical protein